MAGNCMAVSSKVTPASGLRDYMYPLDHWWAEVSLVQSSRNRYSCTYSGLQCARTPRMRSLLPLHKTSLVPRHGSAAPNSGIPSLSHVSRPAPSMLNQAPLIGCSFPPFGASAEVLF